MYLRASHLVTLGIVVACALVGCKAPPKLVALDLKAGGIDGTINAPEGAVALKSELGVAVKAANVYNARITRIVETPTERPLKLYDLSAAKKSCVEAEEKNCEVIVEQPDTFLAKWVAVGRNNFEVKVVVTVGAEKYWCQSETLDYLESKMLAVSMVEMCKSLRVRGAAAPVSATPRAAPMASTAASPAVTEAAALQAMSLKSAGIPARVMAPSGATAKSALGRVNVVAGDGFRIEIWKGPVDMAKRKKEIAANTMNELKKYVVEAPAAILYQSELMGRTEYHVLAGVAVGAMRYTCEDTKGPPYTQSQAELMLKACQSLAE